MAFPTTSAIDDFNRADGGLGANWTTVVGTPQILGNAFAGGTGGSANTARYSLSTFAPSQEAWATVGVVPAAAGYAELFYRFNAGTGNGYSLSLLSGDGVSAAITLVRYTANVGTPVTLSSTFAMAAGMTFGVVVRGGSHAVYLNTGAGFTLLFVAGDATYVQTGSYMLATNDTAVRIDTLGGGSVVNSISEPWQRLVTIASGPEYQKRVNVATGEPWQRAELVAYGEPWQRSWPSASGAPHQRRVLNN